MAALSSPWHVFTLERPRRGTNGTINGWGCYNFEGRTVTVGGQARACGQMPVVRSSDGYYYFSVTGGTYPWAGLYAW